VFCLPSFGAFITNSIVCIPRFMVKTHVLKIKSGNVLSSQKCKKTAFTFTFKSPLTEMTKSAKHFKRGKNRQTDVEI
jgi:hypothetical protein